MRRFAVLATAAVAVGLLATGCSSTDEAQQTTENANAAVCLSLEGLAATVEGLSTGVTGTGDVTVSQGQEAINQVAIIRGRLGGLQKNQIETNINSQRVSLENVQAAESAIRDSDIASEVAAMTRAQILVQSTTSVLGIANQQPQSVLSLLR